MLAAKAKEQEDKILDFEQKNEQDDCLEDEIELYQKQVESIKDELKVFKLFNCDCGISSFKQNNLGYLA